MGDMKKEVMFSLRLSEKEREGLEEAARSAGMTVGAYVRKCIELGGVIGANKDLIAHIHKELKRALLETLNKELPVAKRKSA